MVVFLLCLALSHPLSIKHFNTGSYIATAAAKEPGGDAQGEGRQQFETNHDIP
jgi:hypothetical protein